MASALPRPQLITDVDPKAALPAVRALTDVMDRAVTIPGTRISFGLDALLGLIPGIGDTVSSLIGSYIILVAHRFGAPTSVLLRLSLIHI